jgi:hypothetical protein
MSVERSSTQTAHAADDGPDPGPFASPEYSAQQRTSPGSDGCMLDALAAPAT